MSARPIESIVIVGGGIAAWSMAVALRIHLPKIAIELLDTGVSQHSVIDRVGATLPSIRGFHADNRIADTELIRQIGAGVRLGSRFEGWADGPDYAHVYGDYGAPIEGASFHLHWIRARHDGAVEAFDRFAAVAQMARGGRFAPPPDGPSPIGDYEYGLSLEPAVYRAWLRGYALHLGATARASAIAAVNRDAESGFIAGIDCRDGSTVRADLYIDAGGPDRPLHRALDDRFEGWSRWLFVDRILTGKGPLKGEPPVLDPVIAHPAGWRWSSGSLAGMRHGVAYAASALSDRKAEQLMRATTGAEPDGPVAELVQGRVVDPWVHNCVAIGDAAVSIEPLEFAGLHLVHSAIDRIIAKLPASDCAAVELWDYNREANAEVDRVRDFVIAHYATAKRPNDAEWHRVAAAEPPASLAHSLSLFGERGRLPVYEEETFTRHSWAAVLLGQGLIPRRVDGLATAVPAGQVRAAMQQHLDLIEAAVPRIPPAGAYLRHILEGRRR